MSNKELHHAAELLLKKLIRTPSFSREEDATANVIQQQLQSDNIKFERKLNNVWAKNVYFDESLPTLLLNSHHDTVKPNVSYTVDPFGAEEKDGKIFGLGSNDAGASLVGLWATFKYFYDKKLKFNLIYSATAEEEISGENGIASIIPDIGEIFVAIVGEPTQMNMAIAEKGLVVLNCTARGVASHAAHENHENPIYKASQDILKIQNYRFPKISEMLGPVKATVTMLSAGSAHNVVPDHCSFTVDVRTTDCYTNEEIVEIMDELIKSEVHPRSLRLKSSSISKNHPIVLAGEKEGCILYGSPTVSDQALMPFDSVKIGIGDSLRSHTADEFIYKSELYEGIDQYIKILSHLLI